ncbi:MAG: sensor histidine kinase [Pirellula sp.]
MFKSLFTDWSLEKKCLFFLGLALLFSLVLGAVAVQWVAERLVRETIRQSSQDDANEAVRRKHIPLMRNLNDGQSRSVVDKLLGMFDQNEPGSQHESTLLRIKDGLEHESLGGIFADQNELKYLTKIHSRLLELETKKGLERPVSANNEKTSVNLEPILTPLEAVFEDAGRVDGYHVFYHPISFGDSCMGCHSRNSQQSVPIQSAASVDPFRAIKVRIPVKDTSYWRIWSYSLLSSIGIATLALSLFFIHWILKRLVIIPLAELKFVSDEITSGKTDLEFRVETDDEFAELSDSFNRMLRHITSTQTEIQAVNQELDSRIDELAGVNLQLYEANRLKGEFLANMSHELRTPLNSILGFSDVLSGIETLTDKQRRWVGNIQNSGRVLLEMINDILDLAKIEAGKTEVRPSTFDLIGLIYAQIELFRKMAEDKNINLQVDSSVQELRIEQDQGKISQILTNLISNAIKFTPEGGLVTIVAEACGDGTFYLSVADTGVGIAPYEHEVIFEKFRQASGDIGKDSLTREHSGTGLGLSIVRELCRLLGGDISLTSQIGHGSTFRVVLPMTYGAKQEPSID